MEAFNQLTPIDVWSGAGALTALGVLWWGLLLLRRVRDGYERVLVGLLGFVATFQGLHLAFQPHGWTWFANAIGVICCVGAIATLERLVHRHRNAALALRLSEAREMPMQSAQALEVALHAARAKTDIPRIILESAPMPMFAIGLDGSVNFWNTAAERLLGWSREEVLGNHMPNLIAYSGGGVFEGGPLRLVRKDGATLTNAVQSVPVRDSQGAVSGILTIVTPVQAVEQLS